MNIRRRLPLAFAACAAVLLCAARASADPCSDLATSVHLPQVTIISAAVPTGATYCRVVGAATPTLHSNIGFEVWLPTTRWNGKFQGVGSGGSAGSIATPALQAAVARNYAAMATDNGHSGSSWTFAHEPTGDPEKVTDFGWRAEHVSTVAAKAIVQAFYGTAPAHSYFVGCSQGGHHALMEAQRFPEDYDGIIGGDPANNWNHLMLGELWTGVVSGLRNPANELPQAKLDTLMSALLVACDKNDGIIDGIIEDPRTCNFDPSVTRCPGGVDATNCLSDGQLQAIHDIYAGPTNPSTGAQIFPGFAHSSENALRQVLVGTMSRGVRIPGGSSNSFFGEGIFASMGWNPATFDFSVEPSRTDNTMAATETWGQALNANDPDLRPLARRGGKLIMYHGWSDPFITPYNTINYYENVISTVSPAASRQGRLGYTRSFARLFMVPGMWHCAGGPGPNTFDMLTALENWVEKDQAPDSVIGTNATSGLTRPLCAYPEVATYHGFPAPPDEASSFSCVAPAPQTPGRGR